MSNKQFSGGLIHFLTTFLPSETYAGPLVSLFTALNSSTVKPLESTSEPRKGPAATTTVSMISLSVSFFAERVDSKHSRRSNHTFSSAQESVLLRIIESVCPSGHHR